VCDDPMVFMGNKHTEWGHEHEPDARALFIEKTGLDVQEVGFCTRDDQIIGFSPDGLVYDENNVQRYGLEIKCPAVDTHVGYLMEGELPSEYQLQVHWSLAASGLEAWYFMSYFPGLNPFILKVEADSFTKRVAEAQDEFLMDYAPERERVLKAILPKAREELVV